MTHPWIERTSPRGEEFVGRCKACGKTGLRLKDANEPCANPEGMTQDEALLAAVEAQGGEG